MQLGRIALYLFQLTATNGLQKTICGEANFFPPNEKSEYQAFACRCKTGVDSELALWSSPAIGGSNELSNLL